MAKFEVIDTHNGNAAVFETSVFGEALASQQKKNTAAEWRNGVPRYLVRQAG